MDIKTNNISALVLAAGKGTRMHSQLPKVLHTLLGEPMLTYVLDALRPLFPKNIRVVIGHQAEQVRQALQGKVSHFVMQREQLGTGHALMQAWPALKAAGMEYVLVVNGDTPLLRTERVRWFIQACRQSGSDLAFMSMTMRDPGSYGRVLRRSGRVAAVVEAKDYDHLQHGPDSREINLGIYLLRINSIDHLLAKITTDNKSNEYYITDLVALAAESGLKVTALDQGEDEALLGVNTPLELVRSEESLRRKLAAAWLSRGALLRNPHMISIGPRVTLEPGCEITGPCELYGNTVVKSGAVLDSHIWANNAYIGPNCRVRSFSHLDGARLEEGSDAGPFARLRQGSVLEEGAHVGNFVEMKKSVLGKGAKAGHLAYLGDAEIGPEANIGAGTITCNYDGKNKHQTKIGAGAFIGSNASLVAPVQIGDGALVGAGSVITKDVPEHSLAVARGRQKNINRGTHGED